MQALGLKLQSQLDAHERQVLRSTKADARVRGVFAKITGGLHTQMSKIRQDQALMKQDHTRMSLPMAL